MNTEAQKSTDELLRLLYMESSLDHLLSQSESSLRAPDFAAHITALSKRRGEPPERIINRANIEKSFGHQLFSGRRKPSRDTVLQLAFGFELDYPAAQELLSAAQKNLLYPRVKRDLVVIFCLHHRCSVVECQMCLQEHGLPLLGEGKRCE